MELSLQACLTGPSWHVLKAFLFAEEELLLTSLNRDLTTTLAQDRKEIRALMNNLLDAEAEAAYDRAIESEVRAHVLSQSIPEWLSDSD